MSAATVFYQNIKSINEYIRASFTAIYNSLVTEDASQ